MKNTFYKVIYSNIILFRENSKAKCSDTRQQRTSLSRNPKFE